MFARRSLCRVAGAYPGLGLRHFGGNNIPGEHRGYRPLHDLRSDLQKGEANDELWNRLASADKLVTQCAMYGGMWFNQILAEARQHLETVEAHRDRFGFADDVDIRSAVFLIRSKARQVEYEYELDCCERESSV
jgi:hypothetical protein